MLTPGAFTVPRLILEGVGGWALRIGGWYRSGDETFETTQAQSVEDIYVDISLGATPPRTAGEYYNALGSEGWQRVRNSGYEIARDISVEAAAGLAAGQAMRTGSGARPGTVTNNTRGWRVGDPINNMARAGSTPSWPAVRQSHWKNEAYHNPGAYSSENLQRMQQGRAPQIGNRSTGKLEPVHLHHDPPQRAGGLYDFYPLSPEAHYRIHRP